MINLTGLKAAPKKAAKAEKPTLPDSDGSLAALVDLGVNARIEVDAFEASLVDVRSQLAAKMLPYLFATAHGKADVEDTLQVKGRRGNVLLSFKNAYKVPEDLAPVRALLGDHTDRFLRQSFTIKIEADAIPVMVQQLFVDQLIALAKSLDESLGHEGDEPGPVLNAISVTQDTAVIKAFHDERHRLFTPEQNLKIQGVLPATISARYIY